MSFNSNSSLIFLDHQNQMKLNYLDISTTICDVRIDVNNVSYRVLLWTGYFIYFRPSMHHSLASNYTTASNMLLTNSIEKITEKVLFEYFSIVFKYYGTKVLWCNYITTILHKEKFLSNALVSVIVDPAAFSREKYIFIVTCQWIS